MAWPQANQCSDKTSGHKLSCGGVGLKKRCDELGVSCELISASKQRDKPYTALSDHLIRLLKP
jgi:hypothetical protein